ncbi:MAG: hypothetical protein K6G72_00055 [Lachnospiraceae bacterium]|nr:hypothetical protein [Lachnospiraceae bacterium]
MKKNPINKGKRILAFLLGIIWAILVVVTVYDLVEINNFNYYRRSYSGAEYAARGILTKEYGSLYRRIQSDMGENIDVENRPEYKEVLAIHDYIEAGAHYKIYSENGMTERAARYKEKMEEAYKNFGELDFTIDDLNKLLGLE